MSGNTNSDILLAGAIAAFTVDLLVYPLDTLKTRIQSPNYAKLYTNAATQKPNPALFRGLYQGVGSVIIATLPSCENPISHPRVERRHVCGNANLTHISGGFLHDLRANEGLFQSCQSIDSIASQWINSNTHCARGCFLDCGTGLVRNSHPG